MSFSITIHLYCYNESVLYCFALPSCTWKYVLLENWFHSIASEQFFQFTFQIELELKIFSLQCCSFLSSFFSAILACNFFPFVHRLFKTPLLWAPLRQTAVMWKCEDEAAQKKKEMFLEPILNAFLDFFMLVKSSAKFIYALLCMHTHWHGIWVWKKGRENSTWRRVRRGTVEMWNVSFFKKK